MGCVVVVLEWSYSKEEELREAEGFLRVLWGEWPCTRSIDMSTQTEQYQ